MQRIKVPFAQNGDKTAIPDGITLDGSVNNTQGYTSRYDENPAPVEQGGSPTAKVVGRTDMNYILWKSEVNQKTWQEQTFPDWIEDDGEGVPFAYPKNALVKYTDGNTYVSKVDNNSTIPTDTNNWVNFEDFRSLNINALDEKITPVNTDNLAIQETGGLLKKLSFANLVNWIKSFSFGWGQTWQNVTASRSKGVVYTNNTGKPIFVSCAGDNNTGGRAGLILRVDGVTVCYFLTVLGTSGTGQYAWVGAIVPNSSTYEVIETSIQSSTTITQWSELR